MGIFNSTYDKPREMASKFFPDFFAGLPRMDGKVVAVTGCTSGTGFVCARGCAKLGATVVLLNRESERADAALKSIKDELPEAKVISVPCDLTSFASVRAAASKLKSEFSDSGIDVLCNNAGVMASKDVATTDGCDLQMQTNHLSHFLLTSEIWPLLTTAAEKRGEARVVNHSSIARAGGDLEAKYLGKNGGNLGGDDAGMIPGQGARWLRYQQTKRANLVFTFALRDRCAQAGSKVKALVAHPGVASTGLQVTSVADGAMSGNIANALVSQSAEDGAMGIMRCCCDPDAKSGDFYGPVGMTGFAGKAELLPPGPEEKLAPEASRTLLWEESEKTTGTKFTI